MAYDYRGEEIVSELLINEGCRGKGKIKQRQKVSVKCSNCSGIKEVDYQGHVFNRLKSKTPTYLCHKCISGDRITDYNKNQKGKSFEERLGDTKAKNAKSKLRKFAIENSIGERLINYSGISWEVKYGKERSDQLKEQFRKNHRLPVMYGADNPQWGKPAHPLSGKGTKGYYKGIYFRSLMEASFIVNFLEKNNMNFENGELKKYLIPYMFEGKSRNYFCDFVVDNTYYEVKPKSLHSSPQNVAKWEAAKIWCERNYKKHIVMCEDDYTLLNQEDIDKLISSGKLIII